MRPVEQSFDAFVAARGPQLLRLAYVMTGEVQTAEDITQTTLLRMHRRWRSIRHPYSYARQAITHGAIDHKRRESREVLLPNDAITDKFVYSTSIAEEPAMAELLPDLVQSLPTRQRVALVLRYFEHLDTLEIASVMGIRASSVRSALARAIATLRESLAEHRARGGAR